MKKEKKVSWKPTLLISIFLGGLGIDQFILNKPKEGIKKIISLVLSIFIIFNLNTILKTAIKITEYILLSLKSWGISLNAGQIFAAHIPRIISLAVLTLLVIFILSCAIAIFIFWLRDIVSIARKDKFEGIEWIN